MSEEAKSGAEALAGGDAGAGGDAKPFYETFQDAGVKTFAQGFKTPEELAGFGAKFASFKDVDPARLLALPGDDAGDDAYAAIYDRLGRPKEAKEYGLQELEGVSDKEFVAQAEATFHKHGLSAKQAKALAEFYIGYEKQALEAASKAEETAAKAEINQVRQEIGDAKLELGRRVVKWAGLTADQLALIELQTGAGGLLKTFAKLGELVGEHTFEDGGKPKETVQGPRALYSDQYLASLNGVKNPV